MKKLILHQISGSDTMSKIHQTQPTKGLDSRWATAIELEGQLNCLAGNATCSHLVVGGRNAFRVFDVREPEFVEVVNLRSAANLSNLTYSAYDVGWSHLDDTMIASATPNGAIVLWDVNCGDSPKASYWSYSQSHVFLENKRIVNRVVFHPADVSLLLSGSQDGSIKLFDVRAKEHKLNFGSTSESSVRDVQFEPHSPHLFATGSDNGTVQIWDVRNPGRCEAVLQGHTGPCFTLDWHPEERWLASGGRDRTIKVWDFSASLAPRSPMSYSACTISSIASAKWRPLHRFEIATCASLVESGVNIWDVRRPFMPAVFFGRHKDIITGIYWKTNDSQIFYTTSKDGQLCRNLHSEGQVLDRNPVAINISVKGTIVNAISNRILIDVDNKSPPLAHSNLPFVFRKHSDRVTEEDGLCYRSNLCVFNNAHEVLSMEYLTEMAKSYRLSGVPLPDLCDINAKVALRLNKPDIAQVWQMVKLMYPVNGISASSAEANLGNSSDEAGLGQGWLQDFEGLSSRGAGTSSKTGGMLSKRNSCISNQGTSKAKKTEVSAGMSDDESDRGEDIFLDATSGQYQNLFDLEQTNNYFDGFDFDSVDSGREKQNVILPVEGVPTMIEALDDPTGSNFFNQFAHDTWSANNSTHDDSESSSTLTTRRVDIEEAIKHEILNIAPFCSTIPAFDYKDVVIDMLNYYADKNDVQTAVSVIIVLGDRIRPAFAPAVLDQWFTSYIELLGHFELWSIATEVIKLSSVCSVVALTQMSTSFKTACRRCTRSLAKSKWMCEKCTNSIHICSICHLPTKGLFVWCQGCAHGGHVVHMMEWFTEHRECPTGCGHQCEYL